MHVRDMTEGMPVVVVRPPEEHRDDYPTWATEMDVYAGRTMFVREIRWDGDDVAVTLTGSPTGLSDGWWFSPDWLEPVNHDGDALDRLG